MQKFFSSTKELGTLMTLRKNTYDFFFFLCFKIKFLFYINFSRLGKMNSFCANTFRFLRNSINANLEVLFRNLYF